MEILGEPQQILCPIAGYERNPLVSLEEACKPIHQYVPDLPSYVRIAKQNSIHPANGLSPDESAAIQLYTIEWPNGLYRALNNTLRGLDRRALLPWFLYLKLFITALFKLPSMHAVVWRGVPEDLSRQFVVVSKIVLNMNSTEINAKKCRHPQNYSRCRIRTTSTHFFIN